MHKVLKMRVGYYVDGAWYESVVGIGFDLKIDPDVGRTILSDTITEFEKELIVNSEGYDPTTEAEESEEPPTETEPSDSPEESQEGESSEEDPDA
jgi:hypothetical protein